MCVTAEFVSRARDLCPRSVWLSFFGVHEGMRLERMSPRLLESSLSSLRIVFKRAHLKTGGSGIALFKQSMWRAQWVSVCKVKIRTSAV